MVARAVRRVAALVVVVVVAGLMSVVVPSPADGAFPGANGKLVLVERTGSTDYVVTMNADGSDRRRVVGAPEISAPRWSADGQKIVYARAADDRASVYIETMDADGSNVQRVTDAHYDRSPVWSPDGQRIAFSRMDGPYQDLYVIDVDGTNLQRITNTDAFDEKPTSWSPDGSTILFDSSRLDGSKLVVGVFAISPDGSNERLLTYDGYRASGGDFSPDGQRILFSTEGQNGLVQLHTIQADGSLFWQMTYEDVDVTNGAWSPDGTRVVAELDSMAGNPPSFSSQLGVFDVQYGRLQRSIPRDRGNDETPNWQPVPGLVGAPPVTDEPTTTTTPTAVVPHLVEARPATVVATTPRLTG
jgi:TolB protein